MFLVKKGPIDKFYEGGYENENVQVPENNNSSDRESDREFQIFLLVKILVMINLFRSSQQELFCENKCSAKTFSRI